MAAEDEEHATFDDEEDDLEDTEGDDTDMDDDEEDDDGQAPAPPPPPPAADLNSAAGTHLANPYPASDPSRAPQNGAIQVAPSSFTLSAAASGGGTGGGTGGGDLQTPDVKRPRIEERRPNPSASFDESRRLFQRLWTDDDEIKILKGFLEFTSSRGTTFASHQYDTGPFYQQIKNEVQLDFNKNQLIEKLRRLKKKYRNTANRMASRGKEFTFKSPHEKATYDIAKKIWSASIKRSRDSDDDDLNPYANNTSNAGMSLDRSTTSRSRRRGRKRSLEMLPAAPAVPALPALPPPVAAAVGSSEGVVKVEVQTAPITTPIMATPVQKPVNSTVSVPAAPSVPSVSVIEETVKSCLSPIFKELLNSTVSVPFGLGINLPPLLNFGGNLGNLSSDEKWKKQQILELEVYLKRVELVRDQIKATLEELKASLATASGCC